ncbi:hypothetical protein [Argonema antarcticum]|uniref:hypothetical protein n=1 Tax=Argonema antarcticum TaxID=2942763 RepID=UPI0020118F6D|nr:hypothetical protein [Argonema antarcticum]MCL1470130.1 hypothetical protein [Argonema antarcticum A004/B2]
MKTRIFSLFVLLSLACASCQSSQSTPKTQTPSTNQTQSSTSAQQIFTNFLPPSQIYDLQINTPTGVVMRLTQISYAEDSIVANLAITNGSNEAIQLNDQDDMFLYDDLKKDSYDRYGNTYRLSVPPDNPKIQIQPGTTMKGQFVFIGRLSPQAKFLGLISNQRNPSYGAKTKPQMELKDIIIKR